MLILVGGTATMGQENHEALQAKIELQQKKLDIIFAIDHIRDTVPDPTAMLTNIVNVVADHLQVDLAVLSLLDRETGQPEMKTFSDRRQRSDSLGQLITPDLIKRAAALDRVTLWPVDELPAAASTGEGQLAAIPIVMGERGRLGVLLLLRTHHPFKANDLDLLKTVESQVDSAIIQGYTHNELQQHIKELETIYRIDHIRDQSPSFDEMLNAVLEEICKVIQAEMGFIMLYDRKGQRLEMRAATHHDLFRVSPYYQTVDEVAHQSLDHGKMICRNDLENGLRSILCIPLILNEQIMGVLGVVNRYGPRGFSGDDRRLLSAIGSQMDTAIFENIEKRQLREVLGRSVDPRIMARLLDNPDVEFLKGERSILTVLYSDLRGSTEFAERIEPEMLVGFMNHYLGQMTDIILAHEGTLDKFVGDEVMALFGAPFPQADHALRAVQVAVEMQKAHEMVREIWHDRGLITPPIGVGLATGELIVGEMGCPQRADYTVIGRAANLGARICKVAQPGEVLISQATYDLVKDYVVVEARPGLQFKGVDRAVTIYRVSAVTANSTAY
jgi:adenylate cyclase